MGDSDSTARRPHGVGGAWLARQPRLAWAATVVVLPALVAGMSTVASGTGIERDLAGRAQRALSDSGLAGTVDSSGVDLTVRDVPADRQDDVRKVVLAVPGVRTADVITISRDQPSPRTVANVEPILLTVSNDEIALLGAAPSDQVRRDVVQAVRRFGGDRMVVGGMTVVPGTEVPWQAASLARLVAAVGSDHGQQTISWGAAGVEVRGTVPSDTVKSRLEKALRDAVPGVAVRSTLTVIRDPTEPLSDVNELRTQVDQLLADSPVEFGPDSATVPGEAENTLGRLAQLLLMAKDRTVQVTGHVAAGPGDERAARTLSMERAQAVRDKLIALGVPAQRIVADGFGGAQPRTDSNEEGGKAVNRRVEITIR